MSYKHHKILKESIEIIFIENDPVVFEALGNK